MRDFYDLITAYAWTRDDARRQEIGRNVWKWYGQTKTVLVVDLCGFSRRAQGREGLLGFLAVIRRMQAAAKPIVWMHGGDVVKMEADNCFAVFDDAEAAARAAFELVAASATIRELEDLPLELCCGLETGEILLIDDLDFFGEAVNVASRLGEDLADQDDVLAGPAAAAALANAGWRSEAFRTPPEKQDPPAGSRRILPPDQLASKAGQQ